MSNNLNTSLQNSSSSSSSSVTGGGNEHGSQIAISVPIYQNDSCTVSFGVERSGGWTSNSGSSYSAGAGATWRFY